MSEPQPGVMHPVDQAFYDLAIKERDYERRRFDRVEAERDALRAAIEAHRSRWQKCNGTNPNNARPSDLELWAVLGGTER